MEERENDVSLVELTPEEYISRQKLMHDITRYWVRCTTDKRVSVEYAKGVNAVLALVAEQPAANVVPREHGGDIDG